MMRCFETMKEETIYPNTRVPDPEVKAEKSVYYEAVRKVDRDNKEMAERCERVAGREARFVSSFPLRTGGREERRTSDEDRELIFSLPPLFVNLADRNCYCRTRSRAPDHFD